MVQEGDPGEVVEAEKNGSFQEPTLRPDFNVNIRGWENDNEEEAREFGSGLLATTRLTRRLGP